MCVERTVEPSISVTSKPLPYRPLERSYERGTARNFEDDLFISLSVERPISCRPSVLFLLRERSLMYVGPQIFPSWPSNDADSSSVSATPLIMQSELTGLLSLCKLEVRSSSLWSCSLAHDCVAVCSRIKGSRATLLQHRHSTPKSECSTLFYRVSLIVSTVPLAPTESLQ